MNNRDNLSSNDHATSGGEVNRQTSQMQRKDDTTAEFGQNIGQAENQRVEPNSRSGATNDGGMSGADRDRDRNRMNEESSGWSESSPERNDRGSSSGSSRH